LFNDHETVLPQLTGHPRGGDGWSRPARDRVCVGHHDPVGAWSATVS